MGNLTRGNLLATIKSLKKHKRPKVVVANVAVQAICGGSVPKPNKSADLKSVVERRKMMLAKSRGGVAAYMATDEFKLLDSEFNTFITDYISSKKDL